MLLPPSLLGYISTSVHLLLLTESQAGEFFCKGAKMKSRESPPILERYDSPGLTFLVLYYSILPSEHLVQHGSRSCYSGPLLLCNPLSTKKRVHSYTVKPSSDTGVGPRVAFCIFACIVRDN